MRGRVRKEEGGGELRVVMNQEREGKREGGGRGKKKVRSMEGGVGDKCRIKDDKLVCAVNHLSNPPLPLTTKNLPFLGIWLAL